MQSNIARHLDVSADSAVSDPVSGFRAGRIPVELEVPVTWFPIVEDGDRHRWMFARLCTVLAHRPVCINMSPVVGGWHHAPRKAPEGGMVLSYHSVGDEPNVWRIKETPIAGWYSFDANGFSGWSSLARFPERHAAAIDAVDTAAARAQIDALREQFRKHNVSKYGQSSENFDVSRPYVYFPLQKIDDPVAAFCRLNTLEVLRHAAGLAERTGMLLVVKRHPLCDNETVARALDEIGRKFRNVVVSNASIHRHLEGCHSVLVANSGVGMEALLYGKPVFSFAASEYELATTPIAAMEDVEKAFSPVIGDTRDRAARFLAYYLNQCCFSIFEPASIERRIDQALAGIERIDTSTRHDDRTELLLAYGQIETMRRTLSKSQAEFENLRRIAEEAVSMAARSAALRDAEPQAASEDGGRAYQAAMETAGALYHTGLSASVAGVVTAETLRIAFSNYAELATGLRRAPQLAAVVDGELLRSGYATGMDPAVRHRNVTADAYQQLHENDKGYRENNWLVDHCDVICSARPRKVVVIGCGNGRFLHAVAGHVETVIGLDWARSSRLGELPANVRFQQADVLADSLPQSDVCCSADVLEHFEPAVLPELLRRMHASAPVNYHVIACYDDGHSHCSVLNPGQWLGLFKSLDPAYQLAAVLTRPSRPDRLVCVVTNLKQASAHFPRLGPITGTWGTDAGQQVTFGNDFTVHVGDRVAATWFPLADGRGAMSWTESGMIDILRPAPEGGRLEVRNVKGGSHEVARVISQAGR